MTKIPKQIDPNKNLVRSWSISSPSFYGQKTLGSFVDELIETEQLLKKGYCSNLNPKICRVLAAFHGPTGAKVPLVNSTISGCIRPAFIKLNGWLQPGNMSCYNGGCYLFHARAVPAKRSHEPRIRAHINQPASLKEAARLARHYGLPIRDNQSSDGSLSMALHVKGGNKPQLLHNLSCLVEEGFGDVNYLCFSSAYTKIPTNVLKMYSEFPSLVLHVTVSGWHSIEENNLRMNEFDRYRNWLPNVFLRVVNRQDWSEAGRFSEDTGARCEEWLLEEIVRRKAIKRVIRTPFHSVHPFKGSRTGSLGSRHMAHTDYSHVWKQISPKTVGECCKTGKCKTCSILCGIYNPKQTTQDPLIAARALEFMLYFERKRQNRKGKTPLALYTARMLAKKAKEQFKVAKETGKASEMETRHKRLGEECKKLNLSSLERRRLSNDCHALVVDGLDRHSLWRLDS